MFASRHHLKFAGHYPKLLLPAATAWDNVWSAIQGVWSVATDPTKRQAFEDAIAANIIKDTVMQNAYNGSTLTFSLFHNIQDPLWKRNKDSPFDFKEFSQAVGPALTNLHDYLLTLQNEIRQDFENQKQHIAAESTATDASDTPEEKPSSSQGDARDGDMGSEENTLLEGLGHLIHASPVERAHWMRYVQEPYPWRKLAADDPDSTAGVLSRITTPEYLDNLCRSIKLGQIVSNKAIYEQGSSTVGQVAILSARAMELPLPGQKEGDDDNKDDYRYEEFKASEQKDLKMGVAAQIDVLYELTNRYYEQVPDRVVVDENAPLPSAMILKPTGEPGTDETMVAKGKTEHVEYTSLGVAVLEGWIDRGEEEEERVQGKLSSTENDENETRGGLRWRVPLMREPSEFPMTIATIRTVLMAGEGEPDSKSSDDSTARTTTAAEKKESGSSSSE